MQQTLRRLAVLQCHLEGIQRDAAFQPFAQRPADHAGARTGSTAFFAKESE
jgi:hypothetical protein